MRSEVPHPRRLRRGAGWLRFLGDDADVPGFKPEDGVVLQPNPPPAIFIMAEAVGMVLNHPGQVAGLATIHPGQCGLVPSPAPVGVVLGNYRLPRVGTAGGEDESRRQKDGQEFSFHF